MFASRVAIVACMVCILSSALILGAGMIVNTSSESWLLYTLQSSPRSQAMRIAVIDMERLLSATFYADDDPTARTPRLSPDRSHIIFASIGGKIQVMDSTHPHAVIDFPPATIPVWSPQTQNFALRVDRHLYLTTDGITLARITDYDDIMSEFSPDWSPDGERIAFQVQFSAPNGQRSEIHVREADLTSHTISHDLTTNDYFPAWSPDGTRIAFIAQRNDILTLTIMDADGRNRYAPANLPLVNVGSVTWSPDGRTIALVGTLRRGSRLFLIDVAQENATTSPALPEQVSNAVVWSPDSAQLAFSLQGTDEVYVLTVATGNIRQITPNARTNIILP